MLVAPDQAFKVQRLICLFGVDAANVGILGTAVHIDSQGSEFDLTCQANQLFVGLVVNDELYQLWFDFVYFRSGQRSNYSNCLMALLPTLDEKR